ncbi:type I restriction enzyme HsdR N-terminal domain-containing protein [Terrimonas alba]|uniref:type I restriction enzyme HsdR N-terminal domain-containing protein n=1 Tax=Terrimonas alba TaxID=3349636 RepID=UPI0035F26A6F
MLTIHYPQPSFNIRKDAGKDFIFDPLRKKWLLLTPEEWVRQNFVQYLVQVKKYPSSLIAMEKTIRLGELKKRFDILVYDHTHTPWMMIECKAPAIKLDDAVLQQLLRYHISVPTGFLIISNGEHSFGWEKKARELLLISELPDWIGK